MTAARADNSVAALDRTTNGKGLIREQNWYGQDGMEHLRTTKKPEQSIPTFAETVALLMKVRPCARAARS